VRVLLASLVVSVLGLTACADRSSSTGPAWPKSAGYPPAESSEDDGGESLEPRKEHLSAVEKSEPGEIDLGVDDSVVEVTIDPEPDAAPATTTPPPDAGPPTVDGGEIIIVDGAPPDSSAAP